MDKYEVLQRVFGYSAFREGQETIIDHILSGRDVLGIMPTGAGKSICYQVPALCMDGITLVVSPLISLMMDQVKALNQAGVHAAYINSSLTEPQIAKALQNAKRGQYKIIYVAPERLETERFLDFAMNVHISMVTIDEAHCISQWGQDFRPSYLKILQFIEKLPNRPVVSAFTATATVVVKEDILAILRLRNPYTLVTGFDRENLFFQVQTGNQKQERLYNYLKQHSEESGVIYCATRKNVEMVWEFLDGCGFPVTKYHAGLSAEERKANQEDFIYDRKPIVVATNAFGMGIDKSNVRYVVHYNMPQSLENYYQEAGRAGRDGMAAECVILYSPQDVYLNKYLIENRGENTELTPEQAAVVLQKDRERLRSMAGYCKTTYCLREYILRYFGTTRWADISGKNCGNCSTCLKKAYEQEPVEHHYDAFWEEEYIGYEGDNVSWEKVAYEGTKRGVAADYEQTGLDGSGGGTARNIPLIRKKATVKRGSYGTGMYGESGMNVPGRTVKKQTLGMAQLSSAEKELFAQLKEVRLRIAKALSLPPYMIFSDNTLLDMCVKKPKNKAEMLEVSGVGEKKYDRYGYDFVECIKRWH